MQSQTESTTYNEIEHALECERARLIRIDALAQLGRASLEIDDFKTAAACAEKITELRRG